MSRRVFISYQHDDQMKAKGFHLLRWNKNVELDVVGRHLLDPVDSTNETYIAERIREQIRGTSVTVVLIGENTADSDWVAREVQWSLEKDQPNGILGIKLTSGARVPDSLKGCGAEVVEWDAPQFEAAIDRAAAARQRVLALASTPGGKSGCIRGA